jgi:hypothetical protein
MKYTYKLNTWRNLALKKRDVYGISSNDFIVIKSLSKCLLYTAALKKHLRKIDVLTDVKHNQIKKVMEMIIDGIDEQRRINRSAIISERGRKHGGHLDLVVYLDFAHQLICNDFMMALDCQRTCEFIPIELQVRRYDSDV